MQISNLPLTLQLIYLIVCPSKDLGNINTDHTSFFISFFQVLLEGEMQDLKESTKIIS